jgi:uncharacterized phage-associated protein
MHRPVAVANKLMELADRKGLDSSFTPMQLLKLVYLCHAWMLGLYGRPLLSESVQAWRYGPVIRSLYDAISQFQDRPVTYPIKPFLFGKTSTESFSEEEESVITQVAEKYGHLDGITLSRMTHMPGSPWYVTWHDRGQNSAISNDLIEHFYKQKYARANQIAPYG